MLDNLHKDDKQRVQRERLDQDETEQQRKPDLSRSTRIPSQRLTG